MKTGVMFLVAVMLAVVAAAGEDDVPKWAEGLCGASLKEAVKAHCSPEKKLTDVEAWNALLKIERIKEGEILNRFGNENFKIVQDGEPLPGVTAMAIADRSWWMRDYAFLSAYAVDLHVRFVCDEKTLKARKDYMPGEPTKVLHDGGTWKTGEDDDAQGVWTFPDGYRGELSRAMLYAACVYPADLWVGAGAVYMEPGSYPSLSRQAVKSLLAAHETEQAIERELERNRLVAAVQGNENPFVRWPELAAHIWGDKKEIPFGSKGNVEEGGESGEEEENQGDEEGGEEGDENQDENNDNDVELTPLRGVYSQADKTVDLASPYVPEDATWTIDGEKVEGRRILVSDLTPGKHELRFEAGEMRGKIVILIAD